MTTHARHHDQANIIRSRAQPHRTTIEIISGIQKLFLTGPIHKYGRSAGLPAAEESLIDGIF
jgi:hypothetical protein